MAYHKNATLRLERLVALLRQSQELLIGLGQYVPNSDPNRRVMEEVCKTNHVVIEEESRALQMETTPTEIWTPESLRG